MYFLPVKYKYYFLLLLTDICSFFKRFVAIALIETKKF